MAALAHISYDSLLPPEPLLSAVFLEAGVRVAAVTQLSRCETRSCSTVIAGALLLHPFMLSAAVTRACKAWRSVLQA